MATRGEFTLYAIAAGLFAVAFVLPAISAQRAETLAAIADAPASDGPGIAEGVVEAQSSRGHPDAGHRLVVPLKAVLASGDSSIPNFDNAVREVDKLLRQAGAQTVLLSSDAQLIADGRGEATGDAIDQALAKLAPGPGEGCLVFVTSHGSEAGLSLNRDRAGQGYLAPERLAEILARRCKDLPTVAILSGCHSGTYVTPVMTAANRIILTAARRDRSSFGCSADVEFTYFDECLIAAMKGGNDWADIFDLANSCATGKEMIGGYKRSFPQSSFGIAVKNLAVR